MTQTTQTVRTNYHDLAVDNRTYFYGEIVTVTEVKYNQPSNQEGALRTMVTFTNDIGIAITTGLGE
jgi:hypothetical protein